MERGSRLLIAHDLPMPVAEVADEMRKLGEGWYMPRDPYAQLDELLAEGQVQLEREGPEKVYAYLHPQEGTVIVGHGETVTAALLAVYDGLRSRGT
jgi:hypothetical protein